MTEETIAVLNWIWGIAEILISTAPQELMINSDWRIMALECLDYYCNDRNFSFGLFKLLKQIEIEPLHCQPYLRQVDPLMVDWDRIAEELKCAFAVY